MATRPLSPHLTVWKWGPGMLTSILHRATGDGLMLVGLPVLLWWLYAIASGPAAYETFTAWMWADLGSLDWAWPALAFSFVKAFLKVVLIGLSWAFFNHLCSGLRHAVLDMGAGYEVDTNNRWSTMTTLGGIVLTAAFWAALLWL